MWWVLWGARGAWGRALMFHVWKEIPGRLGEEIKTVKEKKNKKQRDFFQSKSSRKMFWVGSGEMGSSQSF